MSKTRILVVDDEPKITKYLRNHLEARGYEALVARDGSEGLQAFENELPDLVVLDVRMPAMDGFDVCRRIREWSQTPIIMLTAMGSSEDKVKAFDLGADDYLVKPFRNAELLARVKAVLRRSTLWDERPVPDLRSHNLVINFSNRKVTVDGEEVNLTVTEYRLLSYLARNAGGFISSDDILEKVWGGEYVGEYHCLRVSISRLRQKLGDDSRDPRFIVTRSGIGYMFLEPTSEKGKYC